MIFEHTVALPLALAEARRLLDEFERRIPALPGLVVRVELAVVDPGSTSVHLRGEFDAATGMRGAVLSEAGMRLFRRFAEQMAGAAATRAKPAAKRPSAPPAAAAGPATGDFIAGPAAPAGEAPLPVQVPVHTMHWGSSTRPLPVLLRPAVVAAAAGLILLLGVRRRRRRRMRRR